MAVPVNRKTEVTTTEELKERTYEMFKALRKLKEYEDTGLQPCQIKRNMDSLYRLQENYDSLCEILKEYQQLEADGRLIRTPCKVGDTVYEVFDDAIREKNGEGSRFYICEYTVQNISVNEIKYADDWTPQDYKTLFYNREDAEKEIARMEKERRSA